MFIVKLWQEIKDLILRRDIVRRDIDFARKLRQGELTGLYTPSPAHVEAEPTLARKRLEKYVGVVASEDGRIMYKAGRGIFLELPRVHELEHVEKYPSRSMTMVMTAPEVAVATPDFFRLVAETFKLTERKLPIRLEQEQEQ